MIRMNEKEKEQERVGDAAKVSDRPTRKSLRMCHCNEMEKTMSHVNGRKGTQTGTGP